MLSIGIGLTLMGQRGGTTEGEAPVNLTLPSISGLFVSGETLTVIPGDWSDETNPPTYQWYLDGVAVAGATGTTFLLDDDDIGGVPMCRETRWNAAGSTSADTTNGQEVEAAGQVNALTAEFSSDDENVPFVPFDNLFTPIPVNAFTRISGDDTGFTPAISGGGLWFGAVTGAPDGCVYDLTPTAGGDPIRVTINAVANLKTYDDPTTLKSDFATMALGKAMAVRNGVDLNPADERQVLERTVDLSAGWTGAALGDPAWMNDTGNYTVIRPCAGERPNGRNWEVQDANPGYVRLHGFWSETPSNAGQSGAASTLARVYVNGASHVAVTGWDMKLDERPTVTSTEGPRNGINITGQQCWVEGNHIDGARNGIVVSGPNCLVKGNLLEYITVDSFQFLRCRGMRFYGNKHRHKLYTVSEPVSITSVSVSGTLVSLFIDPAEAAQVKIGEGLVVTGMGGTLGDILNNWAFGSIESANGTTGELVLDIEQDATGLTTGGTNGVVQYASGPHGDAGQLLPINREVEGDGLQDDLVLAFNEFIRGNPGQPWSHSGQGFAFGEKQSFQTGRRYGIQIFCNFFEPTGQNAIVARFTDYLDLLSNSVVNVLGRKATLTAKIIVEDTCSNVRAGLNVAPEFVLDGTATTLDSGNVALGAITPTVEGTATPEDIAAYEAAFVNAPTAPSTDGYTARDYALRFDAGGTYAALSPRPGFAANTNWDDANYDHTYSDPLDLLGDGPASAPPVPSALTTSDFSVTPIAEGFTMVYAGAALPAGAELDYRIGAFALGSGGSGSNPWVSMEGETSVDVTGLTAETEYDVYMRARYPAAMYGAERVGAEGAPITETTLAVAAAATFTTSATGPSFQDQDGVGATINWSGSGTLFFSMKGTPAALSDAGLPLFMRSNGIRLERQSGGNVRLTVQDGTGTSIMTAQDMGYTWSDEAEVRIALSIDMANETVRFWADGVLEYENTSIGANNGALRSNREVWFLSDNLANNQLVGDIEYLRLWAVASADGTDPVSTPYKEVTGPAATANADPWKEGADAT